MTQFLIANMAPIMFASLIVFLLIGYPAAFTLTFLGIGFGLLGIWLGMFTPNLFHEIPDRVMTVISNDSLLAIPFFTFMGLVLERSGMAEDLLDTIGHLFGTARGGLAYAVVFVGALLAATTGVVSASVLAMGLISLPIMMRYGYNRPLASGVIVASGTLAQIIPPSLVLIVLADQLGRSVGDMYNGAIVPGLVLTGIYALYVFFLTLVRPTAAPGLPKADVAHREPDGARGVWQLGVLVLFSAVAAWVVMSYLTSAKGTDFGVFAVAVGVLIAFFAAVLNRLFGKDRVFMTVGVLVLSAVIGVWLSSAPLPNHEAYATIFGSLTASAIYAVIAALIERQNGFRILSVMAEQVTFVMVPPLVLVFLVLGTIFIGLATPTEGGAMGAVGALVLAGLKGRLTRTMVRQSMEATIKLACFVMFILIGARVFSLTFYFASGNVWVEHLLLALPGGEIGFLLVVNAFVFVLAFFLDFFEIAFIVVPLLAPAAAALGIDLIWFGVLLGINMQTSFMHPPFGFALFYLRSVAAKEPYLDRVSGKRIEPVTTGQIYWGAVPFVVVQVVMIILAISFPGMVMRYKGEVRTGPPVQINIQAPTFGGDAGPNFGGPNSGGPNFGGPNFGGPNFGAGAPAPSAPAPAGPNFGGAPAAPAPAGPNFGTPAPR